MLLTFIGHAYSMVNKKRDPTISVDQVLYELGMQIAQKKNTPLTTFVSELIAMRVSKDHIVERVRPFLSLDSVGENALYIRDYRSQDTIAPVIVRYADDKDETVILHCSLDKSDECVHVAFALGLPELGKIDRKGLKSFIKKKAS